MTINSTATLTREYGNLVPTGRLFDGKSRSILFDATRCIGCRHCVQACKDWNDHDRTSLYELSSNQLDHHGAAGPGRAFAVVGAQ